jgi:hypothetical protein
LLLSIACKYSLLLSGRPSLHHNMIILKPRGSFALPKSVSTDSLDTVISLWIASPKFASPLLTSFPPSRCHPPRRRNLTTPKKRSNMLTSDRLHIVSSSYNLSFSFRFPSSNARLGLHLVPFDSTTLPPHCAQFISPYAKDSSTILFSWEKFLPTHF